MIGIIDGEEILCITIGTLLPIDYLTSVHRRSCIADGHRCDVVAGRSYWLTESNRSCFHSFIELNGYYGHRVLNINEIPRIWRELSGARDQSSIISFILELRDKCSNPSWINRGAIKVNKSLSRRKSAIIEVPSRWFSPGTLLMVIDSRDSKFCRGALYICYQPEDIAQGRNEREKTERKGSKNK